MEVVINHQPPIYWHAGDRCPKFPYRGSLIIATDPSKTNMAMVVGNTCGEILAVLQFRAPGRANTVDQYCYDFQEFLLQYFKDCHVCGLYIEAAISKPGAAHHYSAAVLFAIRGALHSLAYRMYQGDATEINNWAWKHEILPVGMRGQHEKGSVRYLPEWFEAYGNNDVTDAVCIFQYVFRKVISPQQVLGFPDNTPESPRTEFNWRIVPIGSVFAKGVREFSYNHSLTLTENLAWAINRTENQVGCVVETSALTLPDIYGHAVGFRTLVERCMVITC